MPTLSLPVLDEKSDERDRRSVAMLGPPNVGKSTLFERLCGLRRAASNFPGTSQTACTGCVTCAEGCGVDLGPASVLPNETSAGEVDDGAVRFDLIDLPGVYGTRLDVPESELVRRVVTGEAAPDVVLIVVEASNLRTLPGFVEEAAEVGRPVVVAVNMIDEARRRGISVDFEGLETRLGVPVVGVSARTGEQIDRLRSCVAAAERAVSPAAARGLDLGSYVTVAEKREPRGFLRLFESDRVDLLLTHAVVGPVALGVILTGLLWLTLKGAEYPSGWIESGIGLLAAGVSFALPEGFVRDLLNEGVLGGVGGVLVFLPQIALLFVVISLLEHSGYLARGVLAIDRVLRPFGLSGRAFVPLMSAHTCAIPAILSARGVSCRRERIASVMAIPFMTCVARLPVYGLLAVALFPGSALKQSLAVWGGYALGACAGLLTAALVRGFVLRARPEMLAIELPPYRRPSVRVALAAGWTHSVSFVRKAGVVILIASLVLWGLERTPSPFDGGAEERASVLDEIGGFAQPVFSPMGFDDSLTVATLASFAAREVFVSAMAVQTEVDLDGEFEGDIESAGLREALVSSTRADGSAVFTAQTSWAVFVFFVLSIQCVPTLLTTGKEVGGKWALVQAGWMLSVAYGGGCLAYWVAGLVG